MYCCTVRRTADICRVRAGGRRRYFADVSSRCEWNLLKMKHTIWRCLYELLLLDSDETHW